MPSPPLPGTASSTIDRLPVELLHNIFTDAEPTSLVSYRCFSTEHISPWLLASVCSHWRAVALSDASLWTNIHLSLDHPSVNGRKLPRLCRWLHLRLSQTLERSRERPLKFVVSKSTYQSGEGQPRRTRWDDFVESALNEIAESALRIRSMHVPLDPSIRDAFDFWKDPSSWTHFRDLTISTPVPMGARMNFRNVTILRSLTLQTGIVEMLELPWGNITCLVLGYGYHPETKLLSILRLTCANLEELDIRASDCLTLGTAEQAEDPRQVPFHFPRLRSLSILCKSSGNVSGGSRTGSLPSLLGRFSCPGLERLRLTTCGLETLLDFIQHGTGDQLHTLSLGVGVLSQISRVQLSEVLASVPRVERLVLAGVPSKHPILSWLGGFGPEEEILVPRMQYLVLSFFADQPHSRALIEALAETRWKEGSLRYLVIHAPLSNKLQELRDGGLRVETLRQAGVQSLDWPHIEHLPNPFKTSLKDL